MSDNDSALSSPLSSVRSFVDELSDTPGANSRMAPSRSQSRASTPKKTIREPSPPHEYVLADNEDIAFLVMFRARFSDAFPSKLIHLGPQDFERGIVDSVPSPDIESFLCALLSLVLNRKKPVERGHYNRALEEAISTQKSQWPRSWHGQNPLPGSSTFNGLSPKDRLSMMRALVLWSLHTSEAISTIIKNSYTSSRAEDDKNHALAVQPWGRDGDRRRYWLIEGRDDTDFRIYRESNPALEPITWQSVGGSIDELKDLARKLKEEDGSQAATRLGERILGAVPRFEASDEKRKRREYRLLRKAQFTRPEPGYSNYEGRTRGKRMKYTFSDEEDSSISDGAPRRPTRSNNFLTEPTVTASGRQTRIRYGALYGSGGESTAGTTPAFQGEDDERAKVARTDAYNSEGFDGDSSAAEQASSGDDEWAGENDKQDEQDDDSDEEMDDGVSEDDDLLPKSLVIKLKYGNIQRQKLPERLSPTSPQSPQQAPPAKTFHDDTEMEIDTSSTSHQSINGSTIKAEAAPITPESGEKPKTLSTISSFAYKPDQDIKPLHKANGEVKPVTSKHSLTSVKDEPVASHFHAPDVSVEALTGQSLAFTTPTTL